MNKHPLTAAIQAELGWLRVANARRRLAAHNRWMADAAAAYVAEAEAADRVWWRRLLRWLGVRK